MRDGARSICCPARRISACPGKMRCSNPGGTAGGGHLPVAVRERGPTAADNPLPLCGAEADAAAGGVAAASLADAVPRPSQADLQAACRRSGGFLGQAQDLLADQAALHPRHWHLPKHLPRVTGCSCWSCWSSWKRPSGTIFASCCCNGGPCWSRHCRHRAV